GAQFRSNGRQTYSYVLQAIAWIELRIDRVERRTVGQLLDPGSTSFQYFSFNSCGLAHCDRALLRRLKLLLLGPEVATAGLMLAHARGAPVVERRALGVALRLGGLGVGVAALGVRARARARVVLHRQQFREDVLAALLRGHGFLQADEMRSTYFALALS